MLLLNSGHIKSHAHVKQNADWIVLYCAILVYVLLYFLVLASNMTWPYDVLIIWYFYGKFLDREFLPISLHFYGQSEGIWRGNNIWLVSVLSAKIKDKEWCNISQKLFQKEHGMTFGYLALLKDMVDHLFVHRPIICSFYSLVFMWYC